MKKRILTMLLAAILLLSLLPAMSLRAEAASEFVASQEQIDLIKKWEGFSAKPYWDYAQWTVGYGTRAPDEHLARYQAEGISHEEAEELLKMYIDNMGKSVNSFIDKFGIQADQQKFDAMLSLTYNIGGGWMFRACTVRTAFIEGWTGSDLLYAMGEWCVAGDSILPGLIRRRLAEANVYLNGIYDVSANPNHSYVQFDANGGETNYTVQCYDVHETPTVRATATYGDYVFQGWYTDPSGGEKIEKLDAGVKGYTLYAHWAAGDGSGHPQDNPNVEINGTPVSYTKEVASQTLNVFRQPVKGALVVDAFYQYDLLNIVAEYTDNSGIKWGKVENVGWVNLQYTQDPVEDDETNGVTVKVITDDVNVRRGPGTAYARVGSANEGDQLVITRTTSAGGYVWGKFRNGWIALKYTNYDDVINGTAGDTETDKPNDNQQEEPGTTVVGTGTVKVNDILYIRQGAGTSNPVVGYLTNGNRVTILEKKAAGGYIWGRIDSGWICMTYVVMDQDDTAGETPKPSEPEQKPEAQIVTGKVRLNSGRLNIRSGPSTGYAAIGSYGNGEKVTILEQQTVGSTVWGKTDMGWISMDYVVLDQAQKPVDPKPEETVPEETEPEETVPEETEPEETVPEVTEPEETEPEQQPSQNPGTTISEKGTVVLNSGSLRVRSDAGTHNAVIGYYSNNDRVTVTEKKTVNGVVWGKVEKGWISLDYVRMDAAQNQTQTAKTGRVNVEDFLRIRSGAGTSYPCIGYYYKDNKVTITETTVVYGVTWGKTDKGWISMDYIVLDGTAADAPVQTPSEDKKEEGTAGTVTGSDLRIRSGAGLGNTIVGVLQKGDKVTILETKEVNGMTWGRINRGWISMDYVKTN